MGSSTCHISSALVPKFKLNWASLEEKANIKVKLADILKSTSEYTDTISYSSQPLTETDNEVDDFFCF